MRPRAEDVTVGSSGNATAPQWKASGLPLSLLCAYARNAPRHPAKVRVIRAIARLISDNVMQFEDGDGRLRIDFAEYIGWSLLCLGQFEPCTVELAVKLMRGGGVFVDVGANRGLFSIAVGAATRCEVIAIEPLPENFRRLAENIEMNPGIHVTAVNCGASATPTLLQMNTIDEGRSAWAKVRTGDPVPGDPYVAGLSLDAILAQLRVGSVSLLKIDVEGYEQEAFKGLDWNGPCRPLHVIMECHPDEHEKIRFLCDRGYVPLTVRGDKVPSEGSFPEGNLHFLDKRGPS